MTNVIVLQKILHSHEITNTQAVWRMACARSERRGNPVSDVFYVDELIAKGLGFALQIRQHPIAILLCIRLLSRVNVGSTISQQ